MFKKLIVALAAVTLLFTATPALAGSNAEADAESNVAIGALVDDHSVNENTSIDKRQLPNGPMGGYGIAAPMIDNGWVTGNMQKVGDLLVVRKVFTTKMLKVLAHKDPYKIYIAAHQSERKALDHDLKSMNLPDDLKIEILLAVRTNPNAPMALPAEVEGMKDMAFVRGHGRHTEKTSTMGLLAGMAYEIVRHGGTKMVVVGEGARKVLEASGWGIQIGSTAATISDKKESAVGTVSGGGIGYGEAEGSYGYKPWIQAWGFK